MAEGGTAKMRAMRARGRDSGGVATAEIKDKVSSMMKEDKGAQEETAGGARNSLLFSNLSFPQNAPLCFVPSLS